MAKIVAIIDCSSDEKHTQTHPAGILVGINLKAGNFTSSCLGGEDYRGPLAEEFPRSGTVKVGLAYSASIIET